MPADLLPLTRRDIRRAVGDEALGVIEQQTEQIHAMAQVIAGCINDIVLLQRKYAELEQRVAKLDAPLVTES